MPEILEFWLARMDGFCRVLASREAAEAGRITPPLFPWGSMGVLCQGTVAYLTTAPDRSELGVCAYGPDSEDLAQEVAACVREWEAASGPGMAARTRSTRPADLSRPVRPAGPGLH